MGCQMIAILYDVVKQSPDYIMTIMVEITLKNGQMITISYIVATYFLDYIITIVVEIRSRNSAGNIYIHAYLRNYQI